MDNSAPPKPPTRDQIALIFPGQGSQQPGMGKVLAEASAEARAIFEEADAVLGRPISKLCMEGTEEELRRTSNTQPAVYVTSAAALAVLRAAGIDGSAAAGHSLGEYTALYAAGGVDFATGLRLLEARGKAMEKAGELRHGAMAALLGIDDARTEEVCREASSAGVVVAANLNSPGQVVISGEEAGVDRAIELAKAAGAKRGIKLNVGGAFHSPLMTGAAEELAKTLEVSIIHQPKLMFLANVSANVLSDPAEIRSSLLRQLTSCVRWSDCVRKMASLGITRFIEVGPGNVLTGLVKRIDGNVKGISFGGPADLEKLRAWLQV